MPTNTDLVKDLPADFEIFGQAVDTQMKTNADAAIAKTIVDAKGDLIVASGADAVARLAVGTNNHVLTADSAATNGVKWAALPASGATYAIFRDVKSNGTLSGTFTSGAWRTRDLNTTALNQITGASLSSNQITLGAGTYMVHATAPALTMAVHQCRFYNITDSAVAIAGQAALSRADYIASNTVGLMGSITITGNKVFELQHQGGSTTSSNGFGHAGSFGIDEVYAQVTITKVA